jgi:hypothetical protein
MKRYKKYFKEAVLKNYAVDFIIKNFEDQFKQQQDKLEYGEEIIFNLSIKEFVYILLYASDYRGGKDYDDIIRKFTFIPDEELFQELDFQMISTIVRDIIRNISIILKSINWTKFLRNEIIDGYLSDIIPLTNKNIEEITTLFFNNKALTRFDNDKQILIYIK